MYLSFFLSLAAVLLYSLLAVFAVWRMNKEKQSAQLFALYAFGSALSELLVVLDRLGVIDFLGASFLHWLHPFGLIGLSLVFLLITAAFLRIGLRIRIWIGATLVWGLFVLSLITHFFGAVQEMILPEVWLRLAILLGWIWPFAAAAFLIYNTFRQVDQPVIRSRVIQWAAAALLTVLGDILLLAGFPIPGGSLHLLGAFLAAYVLLVYNLVDLSSILMRLLGFLMICLVGFICYTLILNASFTSTRWPLLNNVADAAWIKIAILAFLVNPLLLALYHFSARRVFRFVYDAHAIIREYSLRISNILNLEKLEAEITSMLKNTLGVRQTRLFLVSELPKRAGYQLQPVHVPKDVSEAQFSTESPVVQRLRVERRMLSHYELDTVPEFLNLPPQEAEWLKGSDGAMFIPIHTQKGWIGLLRLGAKKKEAPYLKDDLALLEVLADQTAVALENALLFADLNRLNQDLQQASQALEAANRRLREVDELKSAFIGVVTHELRTPIANLSFALQLFEIYSRDRLTFDQRSQLDQITENIKTARAMVDDLVNYALFFTNQVQLYPEPIDFLEVLRQTLVPLKEIAREKGLKFIVDVIGDEFQVTCDWKLMVDAVQQLVQNAIKFTPPPGIVRIICWTTSEALCLDVQDTGIGIPEGKFDLIWTGFTQVGADAMRRGAEGLGLGLALVRFIVKAHGGRVWCESKEKSGSTFGFQIPLEGPAKPLDPERAASLHKKIA